MAVKVEIKKLDSLVAKLRALAAKTRRDGNVACAVGYTASYATHVHENLEAFHPVGQAKFLEQPARTLRPELAQLVADQLAKRRTMAQALLAAGLRLQRESQKLTPVDTGNLRNSAFTRLE